MSNILIAIESGGIVAAGGAASLYNGIYTPDMLEIITNWSIVTGRNVKDPTARQPVGAVLLAAVRGGAATFAQRGQMQVVTR